MNIAIVGASGAVGQEFLRVLEQQDFPVDSLELYGSARSAGSTITWKGRQYTVKELTHGSDFSGVDIAFTSAGGSVSREYAPVITRHGTLMIDNSSAFRQDDDVPLVVPEVNGADAFDAPRGIIANPNCTTILMLVVLKPIHDLSRVRRVRVATYQAASGAGTTAMQELVNQYSQLARGEEPTVDKFAYQLAYNLIPQIDVFTPNDYTKEEMKMFNETRKIMHDSEIAVSATCVRVPVMRAHSESLWIETESPLDTAAVRAALEKAPGVKVVDDPASRRYPMPLETADGDDVWVGRIRRDLADERMLTLWLSGDQIKKGAALNAVQIARYLIDNGWQRPDKRR